MPEKQNLFLLTEDIWTFANGFQPHYNLISVFSSHFSVTIFQDNIIQWQMYFVINQQSGNIQ